MTAARVPAGAWVAELVRRWQAHRADVGSLRHAARTAWFRELLARARSLPGDEEAAALDRFRAATLHAAEPIEARVRRRMAARLAPGHPALAAVGVLETTPDLLSPFDELRAETVHTRLLAWALRPSPELGTGPLRAFLELLAARRSGAARRALDDDLAAARAVPERPVPPDGRVDVWLTLPSTAFAIEAKVDHVEGDEQVLRYREALRREAPPDAARDTVFLTLDGSTSSDPESIDLRWADLLRAWAPLAAAGDTGRHRYLRAWLASVGRGLCGVGGVGGFAGWHWVHQVHTLELFEEVP